MTESKDLSTLIAQSTRQSDYPLAYGIAENVPVYDCNQLSGQLENVAFKTKLKAELAKALLSGPGVFVLKSAFQDTAIIDAATSTFMNIIERERTSHSGGDHFAKEGANSRIWNSLQKLCETDPQTFVRYHANPWLQLASEAWLGPGYQMTAQVNLVRPGGAAQEGHCDYHLGFMTADQVSTYPAHVHRISDKLTLQGAIAHCDMPIDSGTTKLLPFSQNWSENYLRFRDTEIRQIFEDNCVQLSLEKGDFLFFSPGLMHAAGENRTSDIERLANLVQVSSPFGRALESVDRTSMCKIIFEPVKSAIQDGDLSDTDVKAVVASTGEAYPFPTNLDSDPPIGGLTPQSQQQLLLEAIEQDWSQSQLDKALDAQAERRLS